MEKTVKRKRRKNVDAVHYVDNAKFLEEIKKHEAKVKEAKKQGKEPPRLNNYLGDCIWRIANRLASLPSFYGYSFRDEMIADGIENCILYFDRFNSEKYDNPFAYYTQIIKWAFFRRIAKEERNRYILYKNLEMSMLHNGVMDSDENDNLISAPMYDNILLFIKAYEDKEEKKKLKKQTKENLAKVYEESKEKK